jgi:hypothetical protein
MVMSLTKAASLIQSRAFSGGGIVAVGTIVASSVGVSISSDSGVDVGFGVFVAGEVVALGVLVVDSAVCAPQADRRITVKKIKGSVFFSILLS